MVSVDLINEKEWPPFDLNLLDPDELEVWNEFFPSKGRDGVAISIWSFGYICMLELGRTPEFVSEYLEKDNLGENIRQYQDNVRNSRRDR